MSNPEAAAFKEQHQPCIHPSMPTPLAFRSYHMRYRRLGWSYVALLVASIMLFGGVGPARAAGPAALVKDINPRASERW